MSNDRPGPIESKIQEVRALLESRADQIASVATQGYSVPALIATIEQAIRGMPALVSCTTESFLKAAMDAAALGLRPDKHQGAFVPQRNKESMEVQFRADWKGLVFALKAQGCVRHIYAHVVRQGDVIEIVTGSAPRVSHAPALTDPLGPPTAYYSVAILPDGSTDIEWMSAGQIEKHRARYAPKNDIWKSEPEEMGRKAVLHRHIKRLGLASDALGAVFGALPDEPKDDPADRPQTLGDLPVMQSPAAPPPPATVAPAAVAGPPAAPVLAGSQPSPAAPSPAGPAGTPSSDAGTKGTGQPDSPAPEVAARKRAIDKARRAVHAAAKDLAALRGQGDDAAHDIAKAAAVACSVLTPEGSLKSLGHAAGDDEATHARKLAAWQAIHAQINREISTTTVQVPVADPLASRRDKLLGLLRAWSGTEPDAGLLDGAAGEYAKMPWEKAKDDDAAMSAIIRGIVTRAREDKNPAVAAYLAAQQNGDK